MIKSNNNSILQHYLQVSSETADFFAHPLRPQWPEVCNAVLKRFDNRRFLEILANQNRVVKSKEARLNVDKLHNADTLLVVTGQQLGLFVSPLYTVYKIVTAIRLAETLQKEHNSFHFVPVFWLEGEDHDFDEVNRTHIWNAQNDLTTLRYEEPPRERQLAIHQRQLGEQMHRLLDELHQQLQPTEFTEGLLQRLKNAFEPGQSWTDAFANFLRQLFEDDGLLLFNPSTPEVKKASKTFFKSLIRDNEPLIDRLFRQSDRVDKAGFKNQALVDKERSNLFLSYEEGERRHLMRGDDQQFYCKGLDDVWSRDDVLKLMDEHPRWFSSSVLTRPLWQSWMLPVVSYVAGPAEIAYWAQLRPSFELFRITMPHVMPRISLTLIEPHIKRLLQKYQLQPGDIHSDREAFLAEMVRTHQLSDVERQFKDVERSLDQYEKQITASTEAIDPTLKKQVKKAFDNARNGLQKLQGRLIRSVEEKEDRIVRHAQTLYDHFYPDGVLQERQIGSVYFLNKYHHTWLQKIKENGELWNFDHQFIFL